MLKKGSAAAKAFMAKLRAAKGKKKPAAKIKKIGDLKKEFQNSHNIANLTVEDIRFIQDALLKRNIDFEYNDNETKIYFDINKLDAKNRNKIQKILDNKKKQILFDFATKKPAAKKRSLKTGFSNKEYDLRHQAKAPGKRISKEGNKYTENRENRSDKGKLLGIAGINKDALELIADRKNLLNDIQFRQIPLMQKEAKLLKGEEKKRKLASIKYAREFMSTLKKEISMYKKHI